MKRSSRGSERSREKPKVRNKLIIGDPKPAFAVRPAVHQSPESRTVNKSNIKYLNKQLSRAEGKVRLSDGTRFDRNVRATGDRAKAVYGSKRKAMKRVYNIDPNTNKSTSKSTKLVSTTNPGTDKKRKAKATKGNMTIKPRNTNTSGTNSIGQVFSPERPRSRRRKNTFIY
tara:strand:+ start:5150 stop:5662 length:513 start_codon:yes stop_codon:yes gene_type:complete